MAKETYSTRFVVVDLLSGSHVDKGRKQAYTENLRLRIKCFRMRKFSNGTITSYFVKIHFSFYFTRQAVEHLQTSVKYLILCAGYVISRQVEVSTSR